MANISVEEARRIGSRKAAVGFLFMFILTEGLALFVNTREDFSNGIRTFLRGQTDRFFLGTLVVIFCTVVMLGRVAGKQILIDGQRVIVVAMVNAGYTLVASVAFLWLCAHFSGAYVDSWASLIVVVALICGCIWLMAVLGIRREKG